MEKQQAIKMIPDLEGTDRWIRATERNGIVLTFPRHTKSFIKNDKKEVIGELSDVMTRLINSCDQVHEFNEGFALLTELISFDDNNRVPVYGKDWIYFKIGPVVRDQEVKEDKNKKFIDKKLELLKQSNSDNELSIDNDELVIENKEKDENRGEEDSKFMNDKSRIEKEEVGNSQYTLTADQVTEYLDYKEVADSIRNDYKKRLFFLIEFSIKDEDWFTVVGMRRYKEFLSKKDFDLEKVKDYCRPVGGFLKWLTETSFIPYNPCQIYKWTKEKRGMGE